MPATQSNSRLANNFFVQFGVILLLDFSLGGITYFLLAYWGAMPATSAANDAARIPYLLFGNTIESLTATVVLRAWMKYAHARLNIWFSYLLLAVAIVLVEGGFLALLFFGYYYGQRLENLLAGEAFTWAFMLNIILDTWIGLAIFTREERRTRRISEQAYDLLQMKELKTKAELEALQAKINPHFLYNSLNSIASLIPENPARAEQMVLLLAKFFRYSTNAHSAYTTTIQEELEMVKTYLEVEKVRFEEKLQYTVFVQHEALLLCRVPQFLIQPLVENAIKHGVAKTTHQGIVNIKILDKGDCVEILVIDNGAPFPAEIAYGYGLRSTEDKLRLLCGEDATMDISHSEAPYRFASEGIPPSVLEATHYKCIRLVLRKQLT